jgi:hypothetical protein
MEYKSACFDGNGKRQNLERIWTYSKPRVYVVMNRSSTASNTEEDHTPFPYGVFPSGSSLREPFFF